MIWKIDEFVPSEDGKDDHIFWFRRGVPPVFHHVKVQIPGQTPKEAASALADAMLRGLNSIGDRYREAQTQGTLR